MTEREMIDALQSKGTWTVVPRSPTGKVQCWLCNQWQAERYTIIVTFAGIEEQVCLRCHNALRAREDDLESELYMHELNQEDSL